MTTTARAWLVERDPEFAEALEEYLDAARSAPALDEKTRALLQLAHDASVTVLDGDGIREHAERARAAGAEESEILGIIEVVTLISIHSLSTGLPLLYGPDEHPRPPELLGGYWDDFEARSPGFHGTLAAVLPDLFAAYRRMGSVLWKRLDTRLRELALIVADLSTSHLFASGAALHISAALRAGATREEIAAAIALAVPCAERTVQTAVTALTVPGTRPDVRARNLDDEGGLR
ncbi:carboxymuconolactone decarboxylase family protein [Pseudonocardia dioxanivorans]|uniref:carboxymuconolactone decarboxylase family protein n=1 Tax=Pseudonocardia dioxanivorans TaxID=240495 RepID=UPI000CD08FF1|nr:carboxymuconolactone decarboxylase family protein [Pseudonocardia dioxanivorans]